MFSEGFPWSGLGRYAAMIARGSLAPRFGVAHGIYALAAAALALAAVGAVLAVGVLNSPPSRTATVGQAVETSFGSVMLEQQTLGNGLSAQALAGMTHGIQNFVGDGEALQQVQVVIANSSSDPVPYSPDQFSVLLGNRGARRIGVVSSNVKAGTLQPLASIELNLGFVVPRDGRRIVLAFSDARAHKQLLFNLGYTDRAPPGGSHNH